MGYYNAGGTIIQGLMAGQKIRFYIWDSSAQIEVIAARAVFAPTASPMPTADSLYSVNGIAVLDSLVGYSTPAAPLLSAPATAAVNQPTALTLSWGSVATATSYAVQVSTVSTFTSTVLNATGLTTTAAAASGFNHSTKYFWRANATNVTAVSPWSSVWNFSVIIDTPAVPVLSSPAAAAVNLAPSLTVSWGAVTGAASYTLQLSTASDFSTTVVSQSGITTVSHPVSGLASGTTFFWQVNAANIGGTGAWSALRNFATIPVPAAPALSAPAAGAVNLAPSLTMSWETVALASSYALQISTSSAFATTVLGQSGLTTASHPVTGLASGTTFFWQVNATNPGGTGAWSSVWSFSTIPIPAAPVTSAPASAATDQPVSLTLSWGAATNAVSYGLQVSTVSTFATSVSNTSGITTTSHAISGLLNSTPYFWRVNATDPSGTSGWSDTGSFTTIVAIPAAVTLSAPANAAVNQPTALTLSWGSVANAVTYSVQVSTVATFASTVINTSGLTTRALAASGFINSTKYYWRANAADVGGTGVWSTIWSFTVIIDTPAVPVLSAPAAAAVNLAPSLTMSWGAVTGAASYSLQVATASDFSTTVVSQSGITTASHPVSGLASGTTFFWEVNATNVGGASAWSIVRSFSTIPMPAAPVTSAPALAAVNQPVSLTLSWGAAANAATYSLQVSTTSTFATSISNVSGITTTSHATTGLANSTGYFWRVSATNASGTSAWSDTGSFTTIVAIPAAVTLSAPATAAINQPTALTLSWGSVTNAVTYAVQVSTVSTFTSTVLNATGLTTTAAAASGFNHSTRYFWRANAADVGGTGVWSSVWNFSIIIDTPAVPVLASPATGVINQPTILTLSWGAVTGAVSYAVQLSTASDFSTTVANQSGLTTHTPTVSGLSRATEYFWRVSATNIGGTCAWSGAWSFTVSPQGIVIGIGNGPIVSDNATIYVAPTVTLVNNELVYSISQPCQVEITMTSLQGRTTALVNQLVGIGQYTMMLRNRVPARGLYIVRFRAATVDKVMKVMMRGGR